MLFRSKKQQQRLFFCFWGSIHEEQQEKRESRSKQTGSEIWESFQPAVCSARAEGTLGRSTLNLLPAEGATKGERRAATPWGESSKGQGS